MFTLESISEMKRNKSVFTMNDNIAWCEGAGDNRLKMQLSELNKVENAQSLAGYFRQIHAVIKKLECSLAISRHLENQETIRLTILQAENTRLSNKIEQLTKQRQKEENAENIDANKLLQNDLRIYDPDNTMSIVNLQYKYSELWDSYQKILQTLTNKDKQLRTCKDKIHKLETELNETKSECIEKDFKIYELCVKYLRLKTRRNKVEKNLQKEITSLQQFLYRVMEKLANYVGTTDVTPKKEGSQKRNFFQILHKSVTK